MKYRGRNEIYESMLDSCNSIGGVYKTKMMYSGYMSYAQLSSYLEVLTTKKLIVEKDRRYYLTDKGRGALVVLKRLSEILGP